MPYIKGIYKYTFNIIKKCTSEIEASFQVMKNM